MVEDMLLQLFATIKDPDTGRNVSYHRLMQRSKNKFTARLIKGRQTQNNL